MSGALGVSERIRRFPYPFGSDAFRYSTNVEPARRAVTTAAGDWGRWMIEVDGEYEAELALRRSILARDPSRCVVLPHMRAGCWDALIACLNEAAAANPGLMTLARDGGAYVWSNARLGEERRFRFGDDHALGAEPLAYLGSQLQEDVVVLDQREGRLWADAGLVTFAAGWSLRFDIGMSFTEIHGPVPRVHADGVIPRAEQFLLRLEPHAPYRRTNWSVSVDRRLDQSLESDPDWAAVLGALADAGPETPGFGERVQLRVELQHLLRLAGSAAILFLIRTSMLSLAELASVPGWGERFAAVLRELPDDMADYKGLTAIRAPAAAWLEARAAA
jgi:hypothetical protein